jgi:tetratricopeptide (TPR) repeat protein
LNTFENPYVEFYSFREYAASATQRSLANLEAIEKLRDARFEAVPLAGAAEGGPEREALDRAWKAEGLYIKGFHAAKLGRRESNDFFKEALALSEGESFVRFYVHFDQVALARTLFKAKRLGPAEARIDEALSLFPADGSALYLKGEILGARGKGAEAEGAFREAIALEPRLIAARKRLADLCEARGAIKECMDQREIVEKMLAEDGAEN